MVLGEELLEGFPVGRGPCCGSLICFIRRRRPDNLKKQRAMNKFSTKMTTLTDSLQNPSNPLIIP